MVFVWTVFLTEKNSLVEQEILFKNVKNLTDPRLLNSVLFNLVAGSHSYQRQVDVPKQPPQIKCSVNSHQEDDKQPHKLDPQRAREADPCQKQKDPPGKAERAGDKKDNLHFISYINSTSKATQRDASDSSTWVSVRWIWPCREQSPWWKTLEWDPGECTETGWYSQCL